MAITGATICNDAMYQAGVIGQDQGTAAPDADAQLVLRRLNRMLDSWSNESLLIYTIPTETIPLVASTATYSTSLLSGASAGRPVAIDNVYVTYAGVDYQVELIDNLKYGSIGIKTIAAIPQYCYVEPSMPQMTLTFFPVPYATMTANVDVRRVLSGTIAMATSLSLPPGYEKAIVDNLAIDICPSFDREPTMMMLKSAQQSRSVLKVANYVALESDIDFQRDDSYALASICRPW